MPLKATSLCCHSNNGIAPSKSSLRSLTCTQLSHVATRSTQNLLKFLIVSAEALHVQITKRSSSGIPKWYVWLPFLRAIGRNTIASRPRSDSELVNKWLGPSASLLALSSINCVLGELPTILLRISQLQHGEQKLTTSAGLHQLQRSILAV